MPVSQLFIVWVIQHKYLHFVTIFYISVFWWKQFKCQGYSRFLFFYLYKIFFILSPFLFHAETIAGSDVTNESSDFTNKLYQQKIDFIVLDCSGISFIDSVGVAQIRKVPVNTFHQNFFFRNLITGDKTVKHDSTV